jgi:hypothetical protein
MSTEDEYVQSETSSSEEDKASTSTSNRSERGVKRKTRKARRSDRPDGRRSRAWCFTANIGETEIGEDASRKAKERVDCETCRYICFQLEIAPSTGQRHYQGYVHFGKNPVRFDPAKDYIAGIFGVAPHIESAKGSAKQNRDYCSKADKGGVAGTFVEFGDFPRAGERSDLGLVANAVLAGKDLSEIANEYPSQFIKYHGGIKSFQHLVRSKPRDARVVPTVYWYFGPTGVGKSRKAFELFPEAYIKMNNQWWDGYIGQSVVIIDDYRPSLCTFQEFLRILDRYPMRVQVKGSSCELSATTFVITTTSRPEIMWAGRTSEALNQLLRRISNIVEFAVDGGETVWKGGGVDYAPLSPPPLCPTFRVAK